MRHTTRSLSVLLMAVALSTACASPKMSGQEAGQEGSQQDQVSLSLSAPAEGAMIEGTTLMVRGEASGLSSVFVNAIEVPVENGAFVHALELTAEGAVEVVVSGGGQEVRRQVMVAELPPHIVVTQPARGAFFEAANTSDIIVEGVVTDGGGVQKVTVNGQDVTVGAAGDFRMTLSPKMGTNLIKVEATDGQGTTATDIRSVAFGEFAPWGQPANDAITARVSAEGLAMIADSLSDNLGPELLAQLGQGQQPDPGAENEAFKLKSLDIEGVEVKLVPLDGLLQATVEVYGLEVQFDALFEGNEISGEIEADPAELIVNVNLMTDGAGGLDIAFSDNQLEMHDFDFDVRGLLGLVDWIIKGIVEDELEDALVEFLDTFLMEDVLTPETLSQTAEVLGRTADFKLLVTDIAVDPGGLSLATDAALDMPAAPGAPEAPGTFMTPGPAPTDEGQVSELRFSLADDFLNQLFANLWRSDALVIDLGQIIADLEAGGTALPLKFDVGTMATLAGAEGLQEFASAETPVGIMLHPMLPPIIQMDDAEGKLMQVSLGEIAFEFTVPIDGVDKPWATVSTHLFVDVALDPESELGLAIDISAEADVIAKPLVEIDDVALERTLVTMMGLLPGLLTSDNMDESMDMGDVSEINPGLALGEMLVLPDGPAGDFLSFFVDLVVDVAPGPVPELAVLATEVSPINGHTYMLLEPSKWSEAEAFARSVGGHLVTVRSRDENDWLIDTFGRWEDENRDMWIGLHDRGHEGEFVWVSGEPVEWTRWDNRMPDNGTREDDTGYGEDFVVLYGDRSERRDERWNDFKDLPTASWTEGIHGVVEIIPDPNAPELPEEGEQEEGN